MKYLTVGIIFASSAVLCTLIVTTASTCIAFNPQPPETCMGGISEPKHTHIDRESLSIQPRHTTLPLSLSLHSIDELMQRCGEGDRRALFVHCCALTIIMINADHEDASASFSCTVDITPMHIVLTTRAQNKYTLKIYIL